MQNLDVAPTILDFAGVDVEGLGLQGRSLRAEIVARRPLSPTAHVFSMQRGWRSVNDARWKLVYDMLEDRLSLYDIASDPAESQEVNEADADKLAQLHAVVFKHLERTEGGIASGKSLDLGEQVNERLRSLGYFQ